MRRGLGLVCGVLAACGGAAAPDRAACMAAHDLVPDLAKAVEASAEDEVPVGETLSAFEASVYAESLEALRQGVRPWNDSAIGICRGAGPDCAGDAFLGTDVGELPAGEYLVRAELAVPNVGLRGTWAVEFATECTVTRVAADGSEVTSTTDNSKRYEVVYAGTTRGYRLSPLMRIQSPSPGGSRACTYTLTMPHPDGEDTVQRGSWSVPAAP